MRPWGLAIAKRAEGRQLRVASAHWNKDARKEAGARCRQGEAALVWQDSPASSAVGGALTPKGKGASAAVPMRICRRSAASFSACSTSVSAALLGGWLSSVKRGEKEGRKGAALKFIQQLVSGVGRGSCRMKSVLSGQKRQRIVRPLSPRQQWSARTEERPNRSRRPRRRKRTMTRHVNALHADAAFGSPPDADVYLVCAAWQEPELTLACRTT